MKKLMSMILLLTCLALTSAVAEDAAFSIIQEELLRQDKTTDLIEPEVANALVTKLEDAGIPISLNAISSDQPIYKYDFTRMLLQEAWGEYYDWSIEKKHLFDELMVSAGQLPYCYNLLPDASEISQESALRIAFSAIKTRYGVSDTELNAADVTVSYILSETRTGMYRFGIVTPSGLSFSVHILLGETFLCKKDIVIDDLEKEYTRLCDEKGAFFQWPLWDKMDFAASLPVKLEHANASGAALMSRSELEAIANYGFCIPTGECITQDQALQIAVGTTASKYGLEDNWEQNAEIYYSFFYSKDRGYTYRVIFWKVGNPKYSSGIVNLNAITGEVLQIERNGTSPDEYIPYIDRL